MKKIYCKNCMYYKFVRYYVHPYIRFLCKKTVEVKDSPIGKYKTYKDCHDANKDYNCNVYKRKWWKFWI